MSKGFVYELAPTDYFFPFKKLDEAIAAAEKEGASQFKKIVLEAVENAKESFQEQTSWEGDGKFYISGLPGYDANVFPEIFVLTKQINNGTTYLYSPVELPYLDEFLKP